MEPEDDLEQPEPVYTDVFGKYWHLFAHFGRNFKENEEEQLRKICKEQFLYRSGSNSKRSLYFVCKRGSYHSAMPPYCQVRGLFLIDKHALYIFGKHNHPLEKGDKIEYLKNIYNKFFLNLKNNPLFLYAKLYR